MDTSELETGLEKRRGIDVPTLGFVLLGMTVSLLAFVEFVRIRLNPGKEISCLIPGDATCHSLMEGGYGTFLAVPWGAWGIVYWALPLALALLPLRNEMSQRAFVVLRTAVAFVGFFPTLFLFALSYFVLNVPCIVCSINQAVLSLFLLFSLLGLLLHRQGDISTLRPLAERLARMGVIFVAAPLLLAVATPLGFLVSKSHKSAGIDPRGTPFPADWLSIAEEGEGVDFRAGNEKAGVALHLFTDLECEDCRDTARAVTEVMEAYGSDNMQVVVRFFPDDVTCNKTASKAGNGCRLAAAARCAGRQNHFWEFLNWSYESQDLPASERATRFTSEGLLKAAVSLGLEAAPFGECLSSTVELVKVREDLELAQKLGATSAPFIVLNGRRFMGDTTSSAEIADAIVAIVRPEAADSRK